MPAQIKMINRVRKYSALLLLLVFCCYYSGISLFSHVHIVNGSTVVHSHLDGKTEHNHSDSQYAVIDMLSHFHSEYAGGPVGMDSPLIILLPESCTEYTAPSHLNEVFASCSLRGPPQC